MTTISWPEEIAKQLGLLESWVDWFDIMEKIDEYKAVAEAAWGVECHNCDGVLCMACVMREHHEECHKDCPECCSTGHYAEGWNKLRKALAVLDADCANG